MSQRKTKRRRVATKVRVLRSLPDTAGEVLAAICGSRREAEDFVRQGEAIVADGSRGVIRVWRDDRKYWRCTFIAGGHGQFSLATVKYPAAVAAWLTEWWPQLDH